MKKAIKISILGLVLLFFLLSTAGFLILKTDYWENIFLGYVNSQLNQRYNLRLESQGMSGNIFYHLKFDRLKLTTLNQTELISLSDVNLTYNLSALIGHEHAIRKARIDSINFAYPESIDSLLACLPAKKDTIPTGRFNLARIEIHSCNVSDSRKPGQFLTEIDSLAGTLSLSADTLAASLTSTNCFFPGTGEKIFLSGAEFVLIGDSLSLEKCRVRNRTTQANLSGRAHLKKPFSSQVNFAVDDIKPGERFPGLEQVFQNDDSFNLKGQVSTNGKLVELGLDFNGKWRGRPLSQGHIAGQIKGRQVNLSEVTFSTGTEKISGTISGTINEELAADLSFSGIDAFSWGLSTTSTNLQGNLQVIMTGAINAIDRVTAKIDLEESKIAPLDFNLIKGELVYKDGYVAITDTFYCALGETDLKIEGSADLKGNTIDARAYFKDLNADLVAMVLKSDTLVGTIDGFVEATGSLYAPDLRGWFRGDQFGLPNLKFEESIARFGLVNIREQKFGDIFVEATNGQTNLIPETIPLTSLIIRFEGDTTYVQLFKAVGENLDVEVRGNIVKYTDFNLQSIKVSRSGNVLQNIDPIHFSWKEDTLALSAVRFRLNDGSLKVSGRTIHGDLQTARLEFANLSIDPINAFLKGSQGVGGTLEGVVAFENSGKKPSFAGELDLKNAKIIRQKFKNIHLKARMKNQQLLIENLSIKDNDNGLVTGSGFVTCDLNLKDERPFIRAQDSLSLALNFTQFNLKAVNNYLLPNRDLNGKMSGQISVYNYLGDPKMNYDLTINEPVIDKITGKEMTVKGIYQDSRMSFTEMTLNNQNGNTRGRGYLPWAISFMPAQFTVDQNAPLNLNFSMKTASLDFLSVYLDDVESIDGDFNLALSISGTPGHPVRSGNFSVKNATINVNSIENPITGVVGSAIVKDNIMEIVSLTGYMKKPQSLARADRFKDKLKAVTWDVLFPPKIAEDQPNLTISGTLDFTQFFQPRYDITLKGEEIYVRTLLAEQEGVLNATFKMTGKDTIDIEGDVEVADFIIRNEFKAGNEVVKSEKPSNSYSTVNIRTTIPGGLYLKNSQLDSELEGEIWIIRNGNEPYRFSGPLETLSGSFYYYGWEFEIVSGTITFDPTEFNPTLDIQAQVDLASYGMADTTTSSTDKTEMVTVYLTGYLDSPSLEFESANYSQSDILMFLTRAQNVGSETTGQDQLSASAMNVFGMWFERQLERNIGRISGLDDFELRTSGNLFSNQPADQWSVVLGRKLAPNLYVKYERTFSLIEPNQQFGLEYRLNRNMSIAGDVDQEGLLSINYRYKYRY